MRNQGLEKTCKGQAEGQGCQSQGGDRCPGKPPAPQKRRGFLPRKVVQNILFICQGEMFVREKTVYLSMKNVCGKEPQNREAGNWLLLWWSGPARDWGSSPPGENKKLKNKIYQSYFWSENLPVLCPCKVGKVPQGQKLLSLLSELELRLPHVTI